MKNKITVFDAKLEDKPYERIEFAYRDDREMAGKIPSEPDFKFNSLNPDFKTLDKPIKAWWELKRIDPYQFYHDYIDLNKINLW